MPDDRPEYISIVANANNAAGLGVGIKRHGTEVTLTFYAGDEYTSIELYDSLMRSLENGKLDLNLSSQRSS
jgi:hypothetical protein